MFDDGQECEHSPIVEVFVIEEEQYLLVIDTFIIYESIGGSGSTLSGVVGFVTLVCLSPETRESTHPCGNT
jgi:hypothetical protein